jgi:sugar lactone lactonase YvrE
MTPRTVLDNLVFPECPRWHDNALYFSDMHDGILWRIDANGRASKVVEVAAQPAGIGWLDDGTMQIVSMKDQKLLRLNSQGLTTLADLSGIAGGQCNDMTMDREGRAYVGNFGFDLNAGGAVKPTVLIAVERDGKVRAAAEDMTFPNGIVITPDGKTLVVAETHASRLTAFDIGAGGILSNRRIFAPLNGMFPDGMCLDAEGAIWVACVGIHKVIRVREGGEIAQEIELPGRDSFACMLGGPDRRDLYICTATTFAPERTKTERAGRIEFARVDVPGAGLP